MKKHECKPRNRKNLKKNLKRIEENSKKLAEFKQIN